MKDGDKVRVGFLGSTAGIFVKMKYLEARREGAEGQALFPISGHGGEVWWVRHDDETIAAYLENELRPVG